MVMQGSRLFGLSGCCYSKHIIYAPIGFYTTYAYYKIEVNSMGFIIWWKALTAGLIFLAAGIFCFAYPYHTRGFIDLGDIALSITPLGLATLSLYASVEKEINCKKATTYE